MILKGSAHKFGDNINTDYIIAGRYKFKTLDMKELAVHLMEDIKPGFYKTIGEGDIMATGKNFGCGSSREQAPLVIKNSGLSCVIARSFARIFFRNSINVGLLLIEADTANINQDDVLEIDTEKGIIKNLTAGVAITIKPLPEFLTGIIKEGGLAGYFKKYKGLRI